MIFLAAVGLPVVACDGEDDEHSGIEEQAGDGGSGESGAAVTYQASGGYRVGGPSVSHAPHGDSETEHHGCGGHPGRELPSAGRGLVGTGSTIAHWHGDQLGLRCREDFVQPLAKAIRRVADSIFDCGAMVGHLVSGTTPTVMIGVPFPESSATVQIDALGSPHRRSPR
jgi:hypothetical protein